MKKEKRGIGERIREIRKELGLNQQALGESVGLSTSQISAIENEDSSPSLETLSKIARMGKRTIDWVVLGTEPTQGYVQEQETDMRLVRSIIEAVENHLQQNRLTLPPEKVSNIVSVLYDEITEAGSGQVNKGTVARLINLVK